MTFPEFMFYMDEEGYLDDNKDNDIYDVDDENENYYNYNLKEKGEYYYG